MKRFMKNCGIAALVLIAVGLSLGLAGRAAVDKYTIDEVVGGITGGRFGMWTSKGEYWDYVNNIAQAEETGVLELGSGCVPVDEVFLWEGGYDTFDFDDEYAVLKGDVSRYCPGVNIRSLDIEVGGGSFVTEVSNDGNIYLEAADVRRFQGYVEDGTLYIRSAYPVNSWSENIGGIVLYLPENYCFDKVKVETGAGTVIFNRLNAEEISLEAGAGEVILDSLTVQDMELSIGAGMVSIMGMTVTNLEAEVGMGEFSAQGALNGSADVECAMGSVNLNLDGSYGDYNYYLEGALGNICVDGRDFANGFAERTINNSARKDVNVECAMGNVDIWFEY